ncbi:MAG: uL30 family ribosomal protein [Candidatus Nanohaloarchaea archaeon]
MIAAVRVRGDIDVDHSVSRTLNDLKLKKRNQLVLYEKNDSLMGMLNKAKDYITYGEVSDETVEKLEERAGEDLEAGETVNLSPPSGGFKDTKMQVGQGGTLGKRDSMDELVSKMV